MHLLDVTHSIVYIVSSPTCFGSFTIIVQEIYKGIHNRVSLEFFIDIILPTTLWPSGH